MGKVAAYLTSLYLRRDRNVRLEAGTPAVILVPKSTADVASAVRFAKTNALDLSVRGGGHSVVSQLPDCCGGQHLCQAPPLLFAGDAEGTLCSEHKLVCAVQKGESVCQGVLVDLAALKAVNVNADARVAAVEGGATIGTSTPQPRPFRFWCHWASAPKVSQSPHSC